MSCLASSNVLLTLFSIDGLIDRLIPLIRNRERYVQLAYENFGYIDPSSFGAADYYWIATSAMYYAASMDPSSNGPVVKKAHTNLNFINTAEDFWVGFELHYDFGYTVNILNHHQNDNQRLFDETAQLHSVILPIIRNQDTNGKRAPDTNSSGEPTLEHRQEQ